MVPLVSGIAKAGSEAATVALPRLSAEVPACNGQSFPRAACSQWLRINAAPAPSLSIYNSKTTNNSFVGLSGVGIEQPRLKKLYTYRDKGADAWFDIPSLHLILGVQQAVVQTGRLVRK